MACLWAAVCLLTVVPGPARAQTGVSTHVDSCVPIDPERFRRILAIELGAATDYLQDNATERNPVTVSLSCVDAGIQLLLEDAVTRKSMTRIVDVQRVEPQSRSRLMALTVAEFVVASWLEIRLPKQAVAEPVGPAPSRELERNVARVVDERMPDWRAWQLGAAFDLMVFASAISPIPSGSLRLSHQLSPSLLLGVGLQFGVGVLDGTLKSLAQDVQLKLITTSMSLALHYRALFGDFDASTGLGARLGFAYLKAITQPRDPNLEISASYAPWGGPMLAFALGYRPDPQLRIALELEVGAAVLSTRVTTTAPLPANANHDDAIVAQLATGWGAGSFAVAWLF